MFATGNHDMEPLYGNTEYLGGSPTHGYGGHAKRLDLPKNGPKGCPSVYSFVYGNVGVISVDANDLSYEIQTNTGYSDGAQLRWLDDTLKEWRTNPHVAPTIDFVVAFFHHCAFSTTANHASDGGLRGALDPLFTKYQVDLVVQGHNHLFERTDPIRHGKPTRPAPDGVDDPPGARRRDLHLRGLRWAPALPVPAGSRRERTPAARGDAERGRRPCPRASATAATGRRAAPTRRRTTPRTSLNSYVWSKDGTAVNSSGYPQGTKVPEVVDLVAGALRQLRLHRRGRRPRARRTAHHLHDPHAGRRAAGHERGVHRDRPDHAAAHRGGEPHPARAPARSLTDAPVAGRHGAPMSRDTAATRHSCRVQTVSLSWQHSGELAAVLAAAGGAMALAKDRRVRAVGAFVRETAVIAVLYGLWQLAGELSVDRHPDALTRARWIERVEHDVLLPTEASVQHLVIGHPLVVQGINLYYAAMHFPMMFVFLIWLFVRHRDRYRPVRTVLAPGRRCAAC